MLSQGFLSCAIACVGSVDGHRNAADTREYEGQQHRLRNCLGFVPRFWLQTLTAPKSFHASKEICRQNTMDKRTHREGTSTKDLKWIKGLNTRISRLRAIQTQTKPQLELGLLDWDNHTKALQASGKMDAKLPRREASAIQASTSTRRLAPGSWFRFSRTHELR
eukprot:scaffold25371_cov34-Tisochrysis_lutea.AAC.2